MAKIIQGHRPTTPAYLSSSLERRQGPRGADLGQCECSRMRSLLQCRLAWYGFRSISVGSLRDFTENTVLVDLLGAGGRALGRIEVDRRSGIVDPSARRALSRLLNLSA
jgi:hypothetical protein